MHFKLIRLVNILSPHYVPSNIGYPSTAEHRDENPPGADAFSNVHSTPVSNRPTSKKPRQEASCQEGKRLGVNMPSNNHTEKPSRISWRQRRHKTPSAKKRLRATCPIESVTTPISCTPTSPACPTSASDVMPRSILRLALRRSFGTGGSGV